MKSIMANLIKFGKSEDTPVAIIEKGATENQRVSVGTVATIAEIAKKEKIVPPAIIIIGDVVNLREEFKFLGMI